MAAEVVALAMSMVMECDIDDISILTVSVGAEYIKWSV